MQINYSKQSIKFFKKQETGLRRKIVEEITPDEMDCKMLNEIKTNKDCHTFVSQEEAMKELNL